MQLSPHHTPHRNRIMIIEDDPQVLKIATRLLQRDFDVSAFDSSSVALRTLVLGPNEYSLVLSDIVMPDLSGIEIVRRARTHGLNIAFVLMSGYAPEDIIFGQLPIGCFFLAKPFDPAELARVLQAAMSFTNEVGYRPDIQAKSA